MPADSMLKVDGASLFVISSGNSKDAPVFLVNGHTRPSSDFKLLMRYLADHSFFCVSFDNRGSGRTIADRAFSRMDMVNDVREVCRHFGLNRTSLIGISMGGVICQHFVGCFPEMVEKLVLISTTFDDSFVLYRDAEWGASIKEIKARLKHYVSSQFFRNNALLIEAMAKQILKNNLDGGFSKRAQMQQNAFLSYKTHPNFFEMKSPTLIVHGADDQIISSQVVAEFSARLDQAQNKTIIYDGMGHLLLAEAGKRLYADIGDFLSET